MDNWQDEMGLQEAKGHIAFLQESLSALSSMCAELTTKIDNLTLQLGAARDERNAAVYAKLQSDDAVEALSAEVTGLTALSQDQQDRLVALQVALDDAVSCKEQAALETTALEARLQQVTTHAEKRRAEQASEIGSLLAALRSSEATVEQMRDDEIALRSELDANIAWQAKVPRLTMLGRKMARLPSHKAAAADAAVTANRLPTLREDFQDLAAVHGIGVAFEQRLYNAGVGTYWELAHVSDDDFVTILQLRDLQQKTIDLDAIRADALRLATETGAVGALWGGASPDDFESIAGIGGVFEQRLYDAGIRTYRTLAATSVEDLAAICQSRTPVAPDFAGWIAQAKALMSARGEQAENAG